MSKVFLKTKQITPNNSPSSTSNENTEPQNTKAPPTPSPPSSVSSSGRATPQAQPNQTAVSSLQDAQIRSAFLSECAARDFLSGYGRNSRLSLRVQEIGLAIDELRAAKRNYLQLRQEMDAHFTELGKNLIDGPYLRDIHRAIQDAITIPEEPPKILNQQTPSRHRQDPGSATRNPPYTPTQPPHRLSQLQAVAQTRRYTPAISTTPPHRQAFGTQRRNPISSRHRDDPCSLCGRMGHIKTLCDVYFCIHCRVQAPGHMAKFCPQNPYFGIDRRDLPSTALELLHRLEDDAYTSTTPITTSLGERTPRLSDLSTSPNTTTPRPSNSRRQPITPNATTIPTTTTTTALGPTYRPKFIIKKPEQLPKNVGNLQQLDRSITRPTSNHSKTTPVLRTPPPTQYPEDAEYEFDDDALGNMCDEPVGYIFD